ncbi:ribosomal protection-like ABC-F family protein [Fusibacter sp. 3D3]|uniref:ribosomal protection-like ABC-F family protein n=1 Tax=Fusibacter sp. 3D3 TaxID=1048380 RepID=UPI000853A359|nr:ABC-F family ATP-binding cassette domain-containing protein [Fusibacter sp. 3D3]GAU77221.1 ATPase components of ABC transporters with duplicated ATPase domains [Fusibacter sp. 3D3]
MIKIGFSEIEKYYGANQVLDKLTFDVHESEVVGILGANGSGKTTIFKLLLGTENWESGQIFISKQAKIGLLEQIPDTKPTLSVRTYLESAFDKLFDIQREMKVLEQQLLTAKEEALIEKYGKLQIAFEHGNGYLVEDQIDQICDTLNISKEMQDKYYMLLSGGEKTRVNLAKILLQDVNVLLLDEPTNHLDLDTIEWLESFLMTFKGIVLIISHDRYFLDQTVTRIIEIQEGKAELYGGGYTFYASEKEMRFEQQLNQFEQNQKKLKQLEAAAKRLHQWATQADNPKLHRQAFAIEKRIERMPKIEKPLKENAIKNQFTGSALRSKEMLKLESVCKSFGDQKILEHVTAKVFYKDQIAILGDNGSGKSTLLKLIMNQLNLDSGAFEFAPSVNVAYLPQEIIFDNPNMTVLEFIMDALALNEGQGRAVLASYKFQQEMVFKKIGALSGGEKTRLKLCEMMQLKVNFLLLDEPTNHLDLKSREWVEDAIEEYTGTLVFVSHDRHFINKFAHKIWWLKDQKLTLIDGDYEQYKVEKSVQLLKSKSIHEVECIRNKAEEKGKSGLEAKQEAEDALSVNENINKKKNVFMINKLEQELAAIEIQLAAIEQDMTTYSDDYQRVQDLLDQKETLETEYLIILEKWENYSA